MLCICITKLLTTESYTIVKQLVAHLAYPNLWTIFDWSWKSQILKTWIVCRYLSSSTDLKAVHSVSFYKEQCKIPSTGCSLKFQLFWVLVFLSYQKYDTRSLKSSKKIGNIPKYKKILYLFSYFVPYLPKFEYWFLRSCK